MCEALSAPSANILNQVNESLDEPTCRHCEATRSCTRPNILQNTLRRKTGALNGLGRSRDSAVATMNQRFPPAHLLHYNGSAGVSHVVRALCVAARASFVLEGCHADLPISMREMWRDVRTR